MVLMVTLPMVVAVVVADDASCSTGEGAVRDVGDRRFPRGESPLPNVSG
jgi:hypothetical protein